MKKIPLIFIVGPTAIGKSKLAINLAKINNSEIINADSMQVYSDLKILTARPSIEDLKIVPHHLYGCVNGNKRYNVAQWCQDASIIINQNYEKNVQSIIVGGTGLYIDKLLNGLARIPVVPDKFKELSKKLLNRLGNENFYNLIYKIDRESCKKISINDTQRMKRIWEVHEATKLPLSKWINKNNEKNYNYLNYKIFLFIPNKKDIYSNVDKRFLTMIDSGAIEEVKKLLSLKLDVTLPIMKAHGVPEILNYLSGSISLDKCIAKGQQVTRNYVKRQFTWWRSSKLDICKTFYEFPSNIEANLLNF